MEFSTVDPTGTLDLRAAMAGDMEGRWLRLAQAVAAALGAPGGHDQLATAADKASAFRKWFEEALLSFVIGGATARWATPYLQKAAQRASLHAGGMADGAPIAPSAALLPGWFSSELIGICDATLQQACRAMTNALLARQPSVVVALAVRTLIGSVGLARSRTLVDYALTTVVSHATLDVLEARGVTHVGVVAELLPHSHQLTDAARKTAQHKHPGTGKFITKAALVREMRRHKRTGRLKAFRKMEPGAQEKAKREESAFREVGEVDVLTAQDDDVCPKCQRISDNGPYPINMARSLIPAHPNCRCVFVESRDDLGQFAATEVGDAAPATLYVHRPVLNADELIAWAKAAGFDTTLTADDMHVTVCFSRTPLDWSTIPPARAALTVLGGARALHQFGAGDARARTPSATVLEFTSEALDARHEAFKRAGASWDHPSFRPHVTITYAKPDGLDLAAVKPFAGPIRLGPEVFASVDENWKPKE